ncbi:signal peptidase II [Kitasatospora sp. NBC_01287]|uniref:signal peptidase II n=1 Tax=Kitasatospora sp. NBC_01287 TaxID=2903573 RepID=UPI00224D2975|nr:signal peptidase II [Kitasatospora sp. NBC_01287]MCX4749619.1 signal peptidase II [Kitasatospora sp. NBC_01287]
MAYARPRNIGPFFSAAERIITTPGSPQTQDEPTGPAEPSEAQPSQAQLPEAPAAEARPAGATEPEARPAGATALSEQRAAVRRRRLGVLFSIAALAYLIDLSSKLLVVARLEGRNPIRVIGDVVTFQVIRNPGAAFGMGQTMTVVFTLIAAAVIVVIWRISRRLYSLPWAVALGLLLGGALGNLTDRLFRAPGVLRGHVVDFISVQHFAVFNLADSAIVCGGILVVLLSFRGSNPDGSTHGSAAKGE